MFLESCGFSHIHYSVNTNIVKATAEAKHGNFHGDPLRYLDERLASSPMCTRIGIVSTNLNLPMEMFLWFTYGFMANLLDFWAVWPKFVKELQKASKKCSTELIFADFCYSGWVVKELEKQWDMYSVPEVWVVSSSKAGGQSHAAEGGPFGVGFFSVLLMDLLELHGETSEALDLVDCSDVHLDCVIKGNGDVISLSQIFRPGELPSDRQHDAWDRHPRDTDISERRAKSLLSLSQKDWDQECQEVKMSVYGSAKEDVGRDKGSAREAARYGSSITRSVGSQKGGESKGDMFCAGWGIRVG